MDSRRQLNGSERLCIMLGIGRYVRYHGRVAGQRAEALLEQLCQFVFLVGQVLLAVKDREKNIAQAREGNSTRRLAAIRISQIHQMQSTSATGNCAVEKQRYF